MKLRGRYRRASGNAGLFDELAVDLFAGGGVRGEGAGTRDGRDV